MGIRNSDGSFDTMLGDITCSATGDECKREAQFIFIYHYNSTLKGLFCYCETHAIDFFTIKSDEIYQVIRI